MKTRDPVPPPSEPPPLRIPAWGIVTAMAVIAGVAVLATRRPPAMSIPPPAAIGDSSVHAPNGSLPRPTPVAGVPGSAGSTLDRALKPSARPGAPTALPVPDPAAEPLEINEAVLVSADLDFGGPPPSVADALREIERRHQPDDGVGRTFAVLDAYGSPTPAGTLHLTMHVSTEKPGNAALVFRRNGQVLWNRRIVLGKHRAPSRLEDRGLNILLGSGVGASRMIDGSNQPASLLDATLRGTSERVRDAWPDGAERELTFLYSACGCPVRVPCRRDGERIARVSDSPVIFPDDPAARQLIDRLVGWSRQP